MKTASYFEVGDLITFGKYQNKKGRITGFTSDPKGNPIVIVEPVPKGKKQTKMIPLFRIRKLQSDLAAKVATRYLAAAHVGMGDTVEQGDVRIHRYRDLFMIWDLTNAGKRGKKVRRMAVQPTYSYKGDRQKWLESMSKAIEYYRTYDQIKSFFKDVLEDFPGEISIDEDQERGVDVTPGGFMPVKVNGKKVYVEVGYRDFEVRDLVDTNNLPRCIPAIKGGKKAIPVFYRWVKDNESKIKNMTFIEVLREMDKLDIPYHDYCAMD
jgi:hypothetical protein